MFLTEKLRKVENCLFYQVLTLGRNNGISICLIIIKPHVKMGCCRLKLKKKIYFIFSDEKVISQQVICRKTSYMDHVNEKPTPSLSLLNFLAKFE